MGLEMPSSMDECIYFTRRSLENDGKIIAWARKVKCPECQKALMGKPVEKGKIKIRASEYICPECGYKEGKPDHEQRLKVEVMYKCPFCGKESEATTEYKRKKWLGVDAFVFSCEECDKKIGITKKMKVTKK